MLKKLLNQATIELTIEAQGPLLIKSGIEGGADPSVPDMRFVRSGGSVYIPGSSLKGVFRSYAEKIARTVGARCCNLFDDTFCGKQLEKQSNGGTIYQQSCRICRVFGSTAAASHIKFNDAYPPSGQNPQTETRTGVAIDRVLGSVAHGPFDFEVVTQAKFTTAIHLRNFELWQLGLIALVLRDLAEGLIPIGFGKSRGLGEVKATVGKFSVRYVGQPDASLPNPTQTVYGLGALAGAEREAYGLQANDTITLEHAGEADAEELLGVRVTFGAEAQKEIFRKCVNERWKAVVQHDRNR
ncbi:MAG: CRISPR-associated RAMP protein Csx7 [Abditibacteriales bacterium]|nr:CRISPR-associated RAMP protein Csx7 [Abditibacteriales bacterium]MDW8365288.1 CRISPR-associated RAMP protein Csx7 [Abditibacteriales bacterium]